MALNNKVETIVLGAFGCGAFMNNPNVVAQASKNVLNEYLYAFKNIEFAVYCSPKDDINYRIFDGYLNHTQNKRIIICNKNRFLMFMTISMVMSTLKCSIIRLCWWRNHEWRRNRAM